MIRARAHLRGRGDAPEVRTVLTPLRIRKGVRAPEVPTPSKWDLPVALLSAALGLLLGQLLF